MTLSELRDFCNKNSVQMAIYFHTDLNCVSVTLEKGEKAITYMFELWLFDEGNGYKMMEKLLSMVNELN